MSNRWRKYSLILIGIGWLVSSYLLLRFIGIAKSGAPQTGDMCAAIFGAGCDSTLMSASSRQLGVALPGWGLLYFAVLGVFLISDSIKMLRPAFLLGAAGGGASLALTGALLLNLDHACPLCFVVHITNILLLLFLWKLVRATGKGSGNRESESSHRSSAALRWVAATAIFMGLCGQSAFLIYSQRRAGVDFEKALADYRSAERNDLPGLPTDPVWGSNDADVRLVVFSSFQCPACRTFSRMTKRLKLDFPTRLQIVFKHYPLSSACNPALSSDMQPQSCSAAYAAQAAQLQGKFWSYHDRLFSADLSAERGLYLRIAQEIGLDEARFERDRRSEEVGSIVRADVDLANQRKVNATPSVFINGKRIPAFSYNVLKSLIQHELNAARVTSGEIG